MTTIHTASGTEKVAYVKGAPEMVLEKCTRILLNGKVVNLTKDVRMRLLKVTEDLATRALRNLAFAFTEISKRTNEFDEKIEKDLVFVGIAGMIDPPRREVKDAIQMCKNAGIRVIMITGDHKLTAAAVAKELNLLGEDRKDEISSRLQNLIV